MTSTRLSWQELCRIEPIIDKYPALPVGWNGGKAPMLEKWQTHSGFSARELFNFTDIKAVGIRTFPLLCLDFDGISAVNFAKDNGLCPDSINCWRINRTTSGDRFKLIFEPLPQQLREIPGEVFSGKTITADKEALEVFIHPGRQVIVLGDHVQSGGKYYWPQDKGPEALNPPPENIWKHVIQLASSKVVKITRSTSCSSADSWIRLKHCPICGRDERLICQIHSDGNTIRCYVGVSFRPPENLSVGGRLGNTEWVMSSSQDVGWGEFINFSKVTLSPLMALRRSLRS